MRGWRQPDGVCVNADAGTASIVRRLDAVRTSADGAIKMMKSLDKKPEFGRLPCLKLR